MARRESAKLSVHLCELCDKPVAGALKACNNAQCTDPYLAHDVCVKLKLAAQQTLRITCPGCGNKDIYRKTVTHKFQRQRGMFFAALAVLATFGPWFVSYFTMPERVAELSTVQLVIFSWLVSAVLLLFLAGLVLVVVLLSYPWRFIVRHVWPSLDSYEVDSVQ
jgi:predicted RNA-binding Zn-ribbon protein involved in translation (DUF1610 family)